LDTQHLHKYPQCVDIIKYIRKNEKALNTTAGITEARGKDRGKGGERIFGHKLQ